MSLGPSQPSKWASSDGTGDNTYIRIDRHEVEAEAVAEIKEEPAGISNRLILTLARMPALSPPTQDEAAVEAAVGLDSGAEPIRVEGSQMMAVGPVVD